MRVLVERRTGTEIVEMGPQKREEPGDEKRRVQTVKRRKYSGGGASCFR